MIPSDLLVLQLMFGIVLSEYGRHLELFEALFPPDYNKHIAPVLDGGPVHVYLEMSILDVDSVDEANMDFNIHFFLDETWRDPRLKIQRFLQDYSISHFTKDLQDEVWKPDLIFDNSKRGEIFQLTIPNMVISIRETGNLVRTSRYNLKVGCDMDLQYYPVDTQHCFIKLALFTTPERYAILHWAADPDSPYKEIYGESIRFVNDIRPLKYNIYKPRPYRTKEVWQYGTYTYLYANLTFERRLSGTLVNVYIPSTLVVCLSWFSFWLDVGAVPGRVTLGVTSLLTLSTQVVQARNQLPPVNYMTALDIWLFVCIIAVFASIFEFALAYHVFYKQKKVKT